MSFFGAESFQGNEKDLYKLSGEFRFKPSMVKSAPKASVDTFGFAIRITGNKPSKPYRSFCEVPPLVLAGTAVPGLPGGGGAPPSK
jgi:hypothetical protein